MKEFDLTGEEYIELNKLMKLMRMASSGGEANYLITEGEVMVNGALETQKRKKLRAGDIVLFQGQTVKVK